MKEWLRSKAVHGLFAVTLIAAGEVIEPLAGYETDYFFSLLAFSCLYLFLLLTNSCALY